MENVQNTIKKSTVNPEDQIISEHGLPGTQSNPKDITDTIKRNEKLSKKKWKKDIKLK